MRSRNQNRSRSSLPADAAATSPRPARNSVPSLKRRVDRLYEEARATPDSEAGQMVRALLSSGIRLAEAAPYQEGESAIDMGRERRRHQLASRRLSEEFKAEARRAKAHAAQLQKVLDEVIEAAQSVQSKKMDARAICAYIADVVGLRPPPKTDVEPEPPQIPMLTQVPTLKKW
jgi:hypothetical protein